MTGCCLAQTWNTLDVDAIVPMNTSTAGTALTTSIANAGMVSSVCVVGSTCNFSGTVAGMTVGANQNACSNLGPVQMNGAGGSLYPAQSLNYNNLQHLDSSNGSIGVNLAFSGAIPTTQNFQFAVCLTMGWPEFSSGSNYFDMVMIQVSNGSYWDLQFSGAACGTGQNGVRLETSGSTNFHSPNVCILPSSPPADLSYYFVGNWDSLNGVECLNVYTTTGTFLGDACVSNADTTQSKVTNIRVFSPESGTNAGTYSEYQNIMMKWSAAAPTGSATFTNGSPTVTGTGFVTDGSWNNAEFGVALGGSCSAGFGTYCAFYTIQSCASSTQCTLSSNFSSATASYNYTVNVPLFWQQTDPWARLLAPGRGATWSQAGVVGGVPSAGWAKCVTTACNTVSTNGASSTEAQIEAAVTSASGSSTYVALPAGTYSVPALCLSGDSDVALRGAGANQTFIVTTSSTSCGRAPGAIAITASGGNSPASPNNGPVLLTPPTGVSGNVIKGTNTLTFASVPNLKIGNPIVIDQLDTVNDTGGFEVIGTCGLTFCPSGSPYTSPASVSPGLAGPYSLEGEGGNTGVRGANCVNSPANCNSQQQMVVITQCDGVTTVGHSCSSGSNVTIAPPLMMPNWTTSSSMSAWWATSPVSMVGIEDMSVDATSTDGGGCGNNTGIDMNNVLNGWVKGVTVINSNQSHVKVETSEHLSIINNYFFLTQGSATCAYGVELNGASQALVENNIYHAIASPIIENGTTNGSVVGYNFTINNYYTQSALYNQNGYGEHSGGVDTVLFEGNITNQIDPDNVHGTGNLDTFFRNYITGPQADCYSSGSTYSTAVYGVCNSQLAPVELWSFHRFYSIIGNVLGTSGVNTSYMPSSACSACVYDLGFGLDGIASDPNVQQTVMLWGNADSATGFGSPRFNCNEVLEGTTFPNLAVSQAFQINPCPAVETLPASFYYSSKPSWWPSSKTWPIVGPDISGGNLLIATSGAYARSLVTDSTQCGGCSTSTAVSGLANSNPAMDCYLSLGGLPNGSGPVLSNFNEASCYASSGQALAPSCTPTSGAVPQTVTCTNPNSGTAEICYNFTGSPATNGDGATCHSGSTKYTGSLSIGTPETLYVVAGTSTLTDSSVVSYTYTSGGAGTPAPSGSGVIVMTQNFIDEALRAIGLQ
jgi:hypothetical protein